MIPGRVACYDRLARLRRTELRRNEAADGTIKEMVAKNPKAGRAYIYRWRYAREFSPPADAKDIQKALELAPDDPEVLFTAAVASEEKRDSAAARDLLSRRASSSIPRTPTSPWTWLASRLEKDTSIRPRPSCGKPYQANPSLDLAFELAENLICQDKIDGKDQAADYIARLRNAGLGDTLVRFLEAEILFQQKKWAEAIPKIEMARAVLESDPRLTASSISCWPNATAAWVPTSSGSMPSGRPPRAIGAPESARIEFARALARSGKLDQAITILSAAGGAQARAAARSRAVS